MSYIHCIARLNQAAGRELTDAEIEGVYKRIHQAALDIKAGRAEKVKGDAFDNVVADAAKKAAADLIREAEESARRAQLQVVKLSARMREVSNVAAQTGEPARLDALDRTHFRNFDGKADVQSFEDRVTGLQSMYGSKLLDTWAAFGKDFFGFWQDRGKLSNLLREVLGEDTGDALAKKGAKAWSDTVESMRQDFNRAGGHVGKLDEGYLPQGWWSQEKIAKLGPDKFREMMLPVLLKTQAKGKHYTDGGIPWDEARLTQFIDKAYDTISTNGHANTKPGEFKGVAGAANRHAEHRQIHFPDAESVIRAWEVFGEKTPIEIMQDHVHAMARDIALTEHYGPNHQTTIRTLIDQAKKADILANRGKIEQIEAKANRMQSYIDYTTGKTEPIAHPRFSRFISTMIPLNVAGKLGGAFWASAIGDKPMMEAVSHLNNLPPLQRWAKELAVLNPKNSEMRRDMMRQGLMLEHVNSGLLRFGDQLGAAPLANKLANAVMRATLMSFVNSGRKGAFGAQLMDSIGHEIKRGVEFKDLHDSDSRILKNYGITEADWNIWKQAKIDDLGRGYTMLTPEAISRVDGVDPVAKRDAIVKLLGAINSESDFAIVTPGMKDRAQFHSVGNKAGYGGELGRAFLQFKSFPWAMFHRMGDAVANKDTPVSKAAMTAYLVTATTLAGAMMNQWQDVRDGKDPRDMTDWRFWGSAFMKGGSLGIYGDFLYGVTNTRYGTGLLETASGPTIGPLLEMGIVQPAQAIKQRMEGKESHLLAKTAQDAKGFIPGSNVWYAKPAFDHLVFQQIFEALSPGYLDSIRQRASKEYNQDFYWPPGEFMPERAPDFGAAMGD